MSALQWLCKINNMPVTQLKANNTNSCRKQTWPSDHDSAVPLIVGPCIASH